MKVTMLTKRVTVNVVSHRASHALEEFLNTPECEGCEVLSAGVTLVTNPDALKKTVEFVKATGTPILGYKPDMDSESSEQKVWVVTVDLEEAIDFTKSATDETATEPAVPVQDFEQRFDGWYFRGVDEDSYGPYATIAEAEAERSNYLKWVEDGKPV
jgi:hypothetical protein